jgi:erythromycin esterase
MKRLIKIFFLLHIVFISKGQIAINNINYKTNNFDDLEFLKDFIKEKRIVCLGEEWHGNETFNEVKNRIVKYLHKELEFEVIIFESGIYGSYS